MTATTVLESWGHYPRAEQAAVPVYWSSDTPPFQSIAGTVLPYGRGRSYGDVCLAAAVPDFREKLHLICYCKLNKFY